METDPVQELVEAEDRSFLEELARFFRTRCPVCGDVLADEYCRSCEEVNNRGSENC